MLNHCHRSTSRKVWRLAVLPLLPAKSRAIWRRSSFRCIFSSSGKWWTWLFFSWCFCVAPIGDIASFTVPYLEPLFIDRSQIYLISLSQKHRMLFSYKSTPLTIKKKHLRNSTGFRITDSQIQNPEKNNNAQSGRMMVLNWCTQMMPFNQRSAILLHQYILVLQFSSIDSVPE